MDLSLWFIVALSVLLYVVVLIDQHKKKDNKVHAHSKKQTETKTMELPAYYDNK